MGTTAAYYCIWNRGFTQDELKKKLKVISGSGRKVNDEFFQTLCTVHSPEVARQIWADAEKARTEFHATLWIKDQIQEDCTMIAYKALRRIHCQQQGCYPAVKALCGACACFLCF